MLLIQLESHEKPKLLLHDFFFLCVTDRGWVPLSYLRQSRWMSIDCHNCDETFHCDVTAHCLRNAACHRV